MIPYYEHRSADLFAFNSLDWTWKNGDTTGWGMHMHHQVEIVYIVEGQADVTIDSITRRLNAGDLAVIFPHCIHGYTLVMANGKNDNMQGLMFSPSMAAEFNDRLTRKLATIPFLSAEELGDEATFVLQQLFVHKKKRHPMVIRSYLQLLFSLIWPQLEAKTDSGGRQDDTPHRTIRYVMENASRPLQAKEVAAAMGISGSHLARIFSGHMRMSFNDYLNQLRIQTAEDLLRSTDRSVTEIMIETGFESQSTFNRAFRKMHGISPREYRSQMRPTYLASEKED